MRQSGWKPDQTGTGSSEACQSFKESVGRGNHMIRYAFWENYSGYSMRKLQRNENTCGKFGKFLQLFGQIRVVWTSVMTVKLDRRIERCFGNQNQQNIIMDYRGVRKRRYQEWLPAFCLWIDGRSGAIHWKADPEGCPCLTSVFWLEVPSKHVVMMSGRQMDKWTWKDLGSY